MTAGRMVPQASQLRVAAGVGLALVLAALPFGFKTVRDREKKVRSVACRKASASLTASIR